MKPLYSVLSFVSGLLVLILVGITAAAVFARYVLGQPFQSTEELSGLLMIWIVFQCWQRGHTPKDVVGRWLPIGTGHTIHIGDVAIAQGDYLLGDSDGMIRIPRAAVAEVTQKSIEAIQTENKVRSAILSGTDPQEAYLQYGKS